MLRRFVLAASFAVSAPANVQGQTLELALHGGPALPSESDDSLGTVAITSGATANVRLGDHIALGLLLQNVYLPWRAQGAPGVATPGSAFPDDDGSLSATLIAPDFRWYIADVAFTEVYVEAAVGYSLYVATPQHPSCAYGLPLGVDLAGGLDASLAPWARLGFSVGAQTMRADRSCTEDSFEDGFAGQPPVPPSPRIALSGQLVFTSVWEPTISDSVDE